MKIMTSKRTLGAGALIGAAFTYALFGLLIREMARMFSDTGQVGFRFILVFIILAAYGLFIRKPVALRGNVLFRSISLGVAFLGVVLLFTYSVNNTTIANSVFLLYGGSIITSLLIGTIVLKEKLTNIKIIAIVLSLIGLYMYSGSLITLSIGAVTGVVAGILDGVSNSIRKTLNGIDRTAILRYQYAAGAVVAVLLMATSHSPLIKTFSWAAIIAGVIFSILLIILGNFLLYGFQHFDVNVGTVILATELFFAAVIGWLFYSEIPKTYELIGGSVIFMAAILSALDIEALRSRKKILR